jgi:hypothetical protein
VGTKMIFAGWSCIALALGGHRPTYQLLVSARCKLATQQRVASARGQAWTLVGQFVSWIVLLSIPLVSMGVAIAALSGPLVLDPMWIVLSLISAVVFLHGAERVRDLAGYRASLQTHRHRKHLR